MNINHNNASNNYLGQSDSENPEKIITPLIEENSLGFLNLFYDTLFNPELAGQKIKLLRDDHSSNLFLYSILIIFASSLAQSVKDSSILAAIQYAIIWFFSVTFLCLLAWLFRRDKDKPVDFGLILFFCAFAQMPLFFLGIGKLWENSSFLASSIPTIICFAWSLVLWGWAIANSLEIGKFKAALMVLLGFLAPFLGVVLLVAYLIIYIFSLIS